MPNQRPTDPLITSRRRPTDAELQQESQITQADIDRAVASFNLHAPPDARGLLEARTEDRA
jgi:hypothetical protein